MESSGNDDNDAVDQQAPSNSTLMESSGNDDNNLKQAPEVVFPDHVLEKWVINLA